MHETFETVVFPPCSEDKIYTGSSDIASDMVVVSSENEEVVNSSSNDADSSVTLLSATATSYEYDFTIEDLIESGANVWLLSAGNSLFAGADTYWLFPDDATLSCVNGYLVNTGVGAITGMYLGTSLSDSISDTSTSWISATLYPWSNTNQVSSYINDNSNCIVSVYYRYGSDTYGYSVGNTSYNTVFTVVNEPALGSDFSSADIAIYGVLVFSLLVTLMGVLLRR